jgi:acylphosphatase
MQCVKLIISGRVQGVGFRFSARDKARQYQIKGYVRNTSSGNVAIIAQGKTENLNAFIKWCHEGPPHAFVDNVDCYDIGMQSFSAFDIKT